MISNQTAYSRLDLAQEQLEVALSLFLENRSYASALTLAGAAEEVFGKELDKREKQNVLDWQCEIMENNPIHTLGFKTFDRKKYRDEKNSVRNSLKHHNDEMMITADLEQEACDMLIRACDNARNLDLTIAGFEEFNDWFYKYRVGEL